MVFGIDGAALAGLLLFVVLPVSCLVLMVLSFLVKKRAVKALMFLPSALVLLAVILIWWAMSGLAGIK